MTKQEAIEKIKAAAARVVKSMDYSGAAVMALRTASEMLTRVGEAIGKSGELTTDEYLELGGVWKIIDSICCGYPMIPAIADVQKASVKKMTVADFVEFAAGELETAMAEKADGAPRIAALKMALAVWEASTDEKAEIPVIEPAGVAALVKGAVVAKMAGPVAPVVDAGTRLEAVAKADGTPPKADEDPVISPAPVKWGRNLNDTLKADKTAA